MTAFASVQIVGLKEALKELNEIDPKLRREVTKDFRKVVDPVIKTAKAKVPQAPPISGWGRNWKTKSGHQMTPWIGSRGDDFIKAKVSGKKPREWAGPRYKLGGVQRGMVRGNKHVVRLSRPQK
jgi:hypothetical protein